MTQHDTVRLPPLARSAGCKLVPAFACSGEAQCCPSALWPASLPVDVSLHTISLFTTAQHTFGQCVFTVAGIGVPCIKSWEHSTAQHCTAQHTAGQCLFTVAEIGVPCMRSWEATMRPAGPWAKLHRASLPTLPPKLRLMRYALYTADTVSLIQCVCFLLTMHVCMLAECAGLSTTYTTVQTVSSGPGLTFTIALYCLCIEVEAGQQHYDVSKQHLSACTWRTASGACR